jgi:cytochrome c-type biogenesis protein CcmE
MSHPQPPSEPRPEAGEPDSGLGSEPGLAKGVQLAIGVAIVAALLGWYGYTNLQQGTTFQYFQNLDEFMATAPPPTDVGLRVHGYVANASIERDLEGKEVRFRVQNEPPHAAGDSDQTLSVVYASLETPDLFKDGAEVVVEGHMSPADSGHVFVAENVMAKCPSKFEAKLAGEQSPEGDPRL